MHPDEFWDLIDRSREGHEADPDGQAAALREQLTGLQGDEMEGFDRVYREQVERANHWDVWGAGYVLAGGMDEERFEAFRDWLVSRGPAVFEQVLDDPDSLADLPGAAPGAELSAEALRAAVQQAHEATYGTELRLPYIAQDAAPEGEPWDEEDLAERFPRLAAKVGW